MVLERYPATLAGGAAMFSAKFLALGRRTGMGTVMFRLCCVSVACVFALGVNVPVAGAVPEITVISPANGAVVQGTSVTIVFNTRDLTVVRSPVPLDEGGQHPEVNRPGQGHVHFYLDLLPVVIWERATPYTFTNVPAGEHELTIELETNDHTDFDPPVTQQLRFRTVTYLPVSGGDPMSPSGSAGAVLALAGLATGAGLIMSRQRRRWQTVRAR